MQSTAIATKATVRYGALRVPSAAARAVDAAFAYLRHDRVERSLIDRLERGPVRLRLSINHRDVDTYDPNTHTIRWDPHSALRTTGGGRQAPALGLAHEIDHAVHDGPHCQRLASTADRRYDTREERRVICGSEQHAARTLGEAVRHDHAGTTYRVASPTAV
jgi:hypothetical protein